MKMKLIFSSLFFSFILLSTTCCSAINIQEEKQIVFEQKESDVSLLKIPNFIYGLFVKKQCWRFFFKPMIRGKILLFKDEMNSSLSQKEKDFFDIRSSFDFRTIRQNIFSIRPLTVNKDVQRLLKSTDTFEEFKNEYMNKTKQYLLWKNTNFSNNYSMVDSICNEIQNISFRWILELSIVFKNLGKTTANIITVSVFAPLIVSCCMYVSYNEALLNNASLRDKLNNMSSEDLVTVGTQLLLQVVYDDGYLSTGREYVLGQLLVS